jgi:hypothetical protein
VSPVVICRPVVRFADITRCISETIAGGSATLPIGVAGWRPRRKQTSFA